MLDYIDANETLRFNIGQTRVCTNIRIVIDDAVEGIESFNISLYRTPDLDARISLEPSSAVVDILSNDGNNEISVVVVCVQVLTHPPCLSVTITLDIGGK